MDKELTPKQQTSEAIRQAESILILTGQHPSVDQAASVIALSAILRKFGKKVNAVISDDIPSGAKFLSTNFIDRQLGGLRDFIVQVSLAKAEVDKIKYTIDDGHLNIHVSPFAGGFMPQDVSFDYGDYQYDLIIVLGVPAYSRMDRVYAQNTNQLSDTPLINIDFHRSNEQYGAINLIEPSAAGLGEILVALSESLQTGLIDSEIATAILAGIYAATDRFTASHTTSKALTVAAQMVSGGADQQKVIRGLYREGGRKSQDAKPKDTQSQSTQRSRQEVSQPAPAPVQPASVPKVQSASVPSQPVAKEEPKRQANEQLSPVQAQPAAQLQQGELSVTHTHESVQQPGSAEAIKSEATHPVENTKLQPVNPLETSRQDLNIQAPLEDVDTQVWEPPVAPELENDGPAVTDPDETPDAPHAIQNDLEPEPLINSEEPQATPAPSSQQPQKPNNPTNNPIFANRLS